MILNSYSHRTYFTMLIQLRFMKTTSYHFCKLVLISCILLCFFTTSAQVKADYGKVGTVIYQNQFMAYGKEPAAIAFEKNVRKVSDFFLSESAIMKNRKGFDLKIITYGARWNHTTAEWAIHPVKPYQYGLRAELSFLFQLFLHNGGKWTTEPPNMRLYINETETGGHGGMINEGDESSELKKYFYVSPLVKEIAPGVHYYNCPANSCGQLVVFNPNQPPYWLPVTVRELTKAKLNFYKNGSQSDKAVYDYIKPLVDAMSEEELSAPAHYGSDDGILNVNGKGQGLQIMRFNPAYWNKALPASAIQYITIPYNQFGLNCGNDDCWQYSREEYYRANGHIEFWQEIPHEIHLHRLADMIQK